ncbi:N-acetylmuramoyl-L-alanine amidase [Streptomyces sp. NPDC051940]|uniref:N-acetylmuramoyl-L-alanine amidase n=1 Tax=Streptomyces sp. NPDC051940 TaxID=3155675 RepID=UPI00342F4D46
MDSEPGGARSGRRALIIGGAGAAAVLALAQKDAIARWWWRVPGNDKPRRPGELDYATAQWTGADDANWRRADRPADYRIDRVVIHVTQADWATTLRIFRDPGHRAATHYVVRSRDGHVEQMVRELDVAYHAGNRAWNERSVGIEHEGFVDQPKWFTAKMYAASARLTADICRRHRIPVDREHIVGHVEVPGTDHTDPGPLWDWDRYMKLVRTAAGAA